MPSTYAHFRFGQEVYKELLPKCRTVIDAFRPLYDIGLHGPDILFYYHALQPNAVSAVGFEAHERPGRDFFLRAAGILRQSGKAELAYIYGVLCHFALDVSCHAYVNQKIRESGISHTEIEGEFDRSLMIADGLNPVTHCLTGHIVPSRENVEVIAPFYDGVTADNVRTALRSMIFQNKMLLAKSGAKRKLIYAVLKLTGNYEDMHGLVIHPNGNPACADSNAELLRRYVLARGRAKVFIANLGGVLEGERNLDPLFRYNFEGTEPESGETL